LSKAVQRFEKFVRQVRGGGWTNPSFVTHIGEDGAGADFQVVEGVLLEGAEGHLVRANILSDDLGGESDLLARIDVYDLVPEKKGSFDSFEMS
jgi:hypothetical protein